MNKLIKFDTKCYITICLFLIFPIVCLSNTLPKTSKSFEKVDALYSIEILQMKENSLKIKLYPHNELIPEIGDTLTLIDLNPKNNITFYQDCFEMIDLYFLINNIQQLENKEYIFEIKSLFNQDYSFLNHLTNEKTFAFWQKKTVTTFSYTENEAGDFLHEGSFFNDLPVGKHIHIENETKIETIYVLGKKHGIEKYYKNDTITKKIMWFLDKKNGIENTYYTNGNLKSNICYEENKKEGLCETYYESGNHQSISFYKENILQGNYKYYYENWQLKTDVIYIEGKLEGGAFGFYEDGKIQLKCSYSNGEFHGKFLRKFANGKPEVETNFNNGKIDGKYIDFYESGKKKSKGIYTENQKIGKWVYWDEKGKKRIEKMDK